MYQFVRVLNHPSQTLPSSLFLPSTSLPSLLDHITFPVALTLPPCSVTHPSHHISSLTAHLTLPSHHISSSYQPPTSPYHITIPIHSLICLSHLALSHLTLQSHPHTSSSQLTRPAPLTFSYKSSIARRQLLEMYGSRTKPTAEANLDKCPAHLKTAVRIRNERQYLIYTGFWIEPIPLLIPQTNHWTVLTELSPDDNT